MTEIPPPTGTRYQQPLQHSQPRQSETSKSDESETKDIPTTVSDFARLMMRAGM